MTVLHPTFANHGLIMTGSEQLLLVVSNIIIILPSNHCGTYHTIVSNNECHGNIYTCTCVTMVHWMESDHVYSSLSPQILICVAQAKGSEDGLSLAKFWGIRFTVISLALNPILYGLLARQYRLAYWYVLKSIFSRCCCRCVEPPETDIFGERVLLFVLEYVHVYTCVHVCKTYTMAKRCICADIHLLMRRIFPKRPRFEEKNFRT